MSFEITLCTVRCRVRPFCDEDAAGLHEALTFPGFIDYLPLDTPRSFEESRVAAALFETGWRDGSRYVFVFSYAAANERSRRVVEKIGARRTGTGHFKPDGKLVPEIIHEITRAEWPARIAEEL